MTPRLVLFDIDGTILRGGKLWVESCLASFGEQCPGVELRKIPFSGKTDRQICRELMVAAGVIAPERARPSLRAGSDASAAAAAAQADAHTEIQIDTKIDAILRGYLDRVRSGLATRAHEARALPGAVQLIQRLESERGVVVALLTGNVREGAELKLGMVGLEFQRFAMGAFGCDHWDRYELPSIAVRRAHERLGRKFEGKQVVIIGDTIHDVGCGQSIGARAIGVGTGQPDQSARVKAAWQGYPQVEGDPRADHFFEDLSDTDSVLQAILK